MPPSLSTDPPSPSTPSPPPPRDGAFVAPRGPSSVAIGWALLLVGLGALFLIMARPGHLPFAPLLGAPLLAAALLGLLGALRLLDIRALFRRPPGEPWLPCVAPLPGEPRWAAPTTTAPVALVALALGAGLGGYPALPYTIAVALALLLPSAARRPGLLVFVVVGLLYLPLLGTYGLWDPWETHYGEVSREILSRDDWISLWWAQDGWFWSKPILTFWLEALSMAAFGVDFRPDAHMVHSEWAVRLPSVSLSLLAVVVVYHTVRRVRGPRAGALAALVLATMPHFFLLAHQAITDMPLVATMTIALCCLLLAFETAPGRRAPLVRVGAAELSSQHLVIALLGAIVLPQVLYLASRNLTLLPGFTWSLHGDHFLLGSAGNGDVPGNAALRDVLPFDRHALAQPITQAGLWLAGFLVLVFELRRERRKQALYMYAFYLFCALGLMAKGLPGVLLPGLVALLYLVASGRWVELAEGRLRVAWGTLVVLVGGMPWYVAMYIRHGPAFTNRLLVHDHLARLAEGVHGDKGTIGYFIEQLGYATFPWVALLPAAGLGLWWWWSVRSTRAASSAGPPEPEPEDAAQRTLRFAAVWFIGTFTLFSAMMTKFHHYIFPAVPPLAIAAGLVLDRLWGAPGRHRATALAGGGALLAVLGVGGAYGNLRGVIPAGVSDEALHRWVFEHAWPMPLALVVVAAGVALLALSARALWVPAASDGPAASPAAEAGSAGSATAMAGVGFAVACGAALAAFVGRDLSWATAVRPEGYERLIDLFVYKYDRPWPSQFDYRPILTGFAVVSTSVFALAAFRRARPMVARAALGLALVFCAWSLDVYLIDLSPHWSQRELVGRYYDLREGPDQPLLAWQMNWKGENYYTGNRVYAFQALDNKAIRAWMDTHRGETAFVVLEHTRLNSFRTLVGARRLEVLTDERFNNKFVLVRVSL
ncbi:MAG: glycosyltransferase family 39 protein [Myxococcales bacterium]|nr:glycosyltransferase family 39 protein [Myxococcales bacterium]